jgi:hypothetical protein
LITEARAQWNYGFGIGHGITNARITLYWDSSAVRASDWLRPSLDSLVTKVLAMNISRTIDSALTLPGRKINLVNITQATTSTSGWLSSTDWNTFNGKVSSSRSISTQYSLQGGGDLSANRTLQLVGDVASPSASYYYGTNSSATRGWFALPAADTTGRFSMNRHQTSPGTGYGAADGIYGNKTFFGSVSIATLTVTTVQMSSSSTVMNKKSTDSMVVVPVHFARTFTATDTTNVRDFLVAGASAWGGVPSSADALISGWSYCIAAAAGTTKKADWVKVSVSSPYEVDRGSTLVRVAYIPSGRTDDFQSSPAMLRRFIIQKKNFTGSTWSTVGTIYVHTVDLTDSGSAAPAQVVLHLRLRYPGDAY